MTAHSCNTDTFAMSEYPDCPWREPVVIDGALYAVSDRGLVALDADDDEGEAFDSAIEWGLQEFGTDRLKRPAYAYIGYESSDVLRFTLEWHASGFAQAADYALPYRVADDVSAGRFRLGRGIRARYFRVGFAAEPGQPFALHGVRLVIDSTSRSI